MPSSRKAGRIRSSASRVQSEYSICTAQSGWVACGPADGLRPGLAQAEMADLALLDQARHRAHGVLDRHVGIDAMDVVEIDHVDAEPLQARLAGDRHVVGLAVGAAALAARTADVAELGGDDQAVAASGDRARDQLLVPAGAIGIRGVEHVDALLDRPMDGGGGFHVVGHAIVRRHAGAAQADGRDARTSRAELTVLHREKGSCLVQAEAPGRNAACRTIL